MQLIINADDFGMTKCINDAIIEFGQLGVITSTTVMVNMPFADDILILLPLKKIGLGLHLTLTQGKLISDPLRIPSLVNPKGDFFSIQEFKKRISAGKIKQKHIFIEVEAQYQKMYALVGNRLDHFDSHQDINKLELVSDVICRFICIG